MQAAGRKVAVVGMGGVFPTCSNLDDFSNKLFSNQSLIRQWDKALAYGKQVRSVVSGYITEEEMGLEAVLAPIAEHYPETYIDTLGRIPDANLSTADMGSIWAMLGALDAIKMAGWTTKET
ncbi:MAG TPA: beta-ketoacyl synthase N-terminal-like domain-containing protein, partial [Mucilaginibacter sp.]